MYLRYLHWATLQDISILHDVAILLTKSEIRLIRFSIIEPVHEISNNVICASSKASDQPAHTRSLIRAFASRLSIL